MRGRRLVGVAVLVAVTAGCDGRGCEGTCRRPLSDWCEGDDCPTWCDVQRQVGESDDTGGCAWECEALHCQSGDTRRILSCGDGCWSGERLYFRGNILVGRSLSSDYGDTAGCLRAGESAPPEGRWGEIFACDTVEYSR
jgi:hypothetical protein